MRFLGLKDGIFLWPKRFLFYLEHYFQSYFQGKQIKKKIAFFDSIWETGKKRGQIANRKIIGERAFSDNAEPGPRLKRNICCGATAWSEQQHNQDLKEMYIGATNSRIHHFLPQCIAFNHTFYHNALHLTRVHCARNKSNNNTGKFASFAAQTQSFRCSKFSTVRLEVLPNLRHAGVFQMSTMVNLGIGFQFKSL